VGCGLIAALFVAGGVPKIRKPFGPAIALVRFGLVSRVRPGLGRLLGAVEVAIGLTIVEFPAVLFRWLNCRITRCSSRSFT
jgi:hypothetical protein